MNANIEIKDNGVIAQVLLNGVDISDEISGVEYVHTGGDISVVILHFKADCVAINSLCKVKFPDSVIKSLTKEQMEELQTENSSIC